MSFGASVTRTPAVAQVPAQHLFSCAGIVQGSDKLQQTCRRCAEYHSQGRHRETAVPQNGPTVNSEANIQKAAEVAQKQSIHFRSRKASSRLARVGAQGCRRLVAANAQFRAQGTGRRQYTQRFRQSCRARAAAATHGAREAAGTHQRHRRRGHRVHDRQQSRVLPYCCF